MLADSSSELNIISH